jgi:hypothetical protein
MSFKPSQKTKLETTLRANSSVKNHLKYKTAISAPKHFW